jgi:hypothetical protein
VLYRDPYGKEIALSMAIGAAVVGTGAYLTQLDWAQMGTDLANGAKYLSQTIGQALSGPNINEQNCDEPVGGSNRNLDPQKQPLSTDDKDRDDGEYLYAFGNTTGPRPPRAERDFKLDSEYDLVPIDKGKGASLWGNVKYSGLTGHYCKIKKSTPLPFGMALIADGKDVGGPHGRTHHTIYATTPMTYFSFVSKFLSLPWEYVGKL